MSTVNVVVAVNVAQAVATGNLGANVYMVDTNAYMGSGGEGTAELWTKCSNGDTIVWTVISIDPNEKVSIVGFSGNAIPETIKPTRYPQFDGTVWGGRVNQASAKAWYTMTLLLAGSKELGFDPFITATNPTLAR